MSRHPGVRIERCLGLTILMTALAVPGVLADGPTTANWPSFRGPRASGVAEGYPTPVSWNVESGENIRWKSAVPGLGHSCPVVWGDRVFVTTAISGKPDPMLKVGLYGDVSSVDDDTVHTWKVVCLDKKTGKLLWEKVVHQGVPKIKRHTKSSHANSTPATDGEHLVVFLGSEGLYGFDMAGKLLWKQDFGVLESSYFRMKEAQWAFGSSPVIHDGRVVVQCDVLGESFLAAFDVRDGRPLWRTARDDVPTWSTPTIHQGAERTSILVNGFQHIGGYDFATGKEIWKLAGGGDIPVPTPVVAHGLIFFTSAHGRTPPIYAVRLGASGDITLTVSQTSNEHVAWSDEKKGAYMPTPLVYGDYLYVCRDQGALFCLDARSGEEIYQQRIHSG
ncbi:MAG: PQQ-binding-like beta-propeller repeat protein, partial [bacterium]|nr:PQQ-binding-like beta-propeller repeat protein [bacterium]